MSGQDFAQPFVQAALRSGVGPTAALRDARAGGLRIGNAAWFTTYATERANLALRAGAIAEPLNRRPDSSQIGQWDTKKRKGYAYRVVGLMTDRETGAIKNTIVTVTSPTLISRGNAINQAMAAFQDPDEKYPGVLLGAFMGGVFEMVPLIDEGEE